MPFHKESSMGLKEQRGYVRRKKLRKQVHGETILRLQGGKATEDFWSGEVEVQGGLLKLEQDAAEALADFWRISQLQTQQSPHADFLVGLRWLGKRRRSRRADKNVVNPSGFLEDPEDALSSAKRSKPTCILQRASSASDRDEIESVGMLFEVGKESPVSESRAESPSSPLPSLQQDFLVGGSLVAKSAFLRVEPLTPLPESRLIQVKTEHKELNMGSLVGRPFKMPPKRKSPSKSTLTVKMELPHEQVVYAHDVKAAQSAGYMPADLGSDFFAISMSKSVVFGEDRGLGALKRAKSGLSEEEKEARKQRRVQANRESARQTIRRKQILCEELSRKAANLTLENKCMKQKRDLLFKELITLKGQNLSLRRQLEASSPRTLGLDPSQPTSFPLAGVPVQSFVWALPVAQAATSANQRIMLNNPDSTLVNLAQGSAAQLQAAGVVVSGAVPAINCEQSLGHGESSAASPGLHQLEAGSMEGVSGESSTRQIVPHTDLHTSKACKSADLSHIETRSSKGASAKKATLQGEGACDFTAMTSTYPNPAAGEVSTRAGCSWSQPTAFTLLAGRFGLNDANGTGLRPKGSECVMGSQIPLALGCGGYTFSGSRVGGGGTNFAMTGQSLYVGKNCVAAVVAAEARRRRKELTRSKFSRARAVRRRSGRR